MILTCNNHFQGIPISLRQPLSCINNFHKLSLVASKQEWRAFSRGVRLRLFPHIANDSDLWNGFTRNINFFQFMKMREKYAREERRK